MKNYTFVCAAGRVCVCAPHTWLAEEFEDVSHSPDINPSASSHKARLDCKHVGGNGHLSSPVLWASTAGAVPNKQGEGPGKAVCNDHGWLCLLSKGRYVSDRQRASYRQ